MPIFTREIEVLVKYWVYEDPMQITGRNLIYPHIA